MAKDVEIQVATHRTTDAAILVEFGGEENVWIPKSQISDYTGDDIDHAESIFIPEWLATEKGMV